MSSPTNAHDEFNHQVAIKLSRALNTLNPNDLLAQRVIDIAKTNTVAGFISGQYLSFLSILKLKGYLQRRTPLASFKTHS